MPGARDILEVEFKGRRKEYAANPLEFPFTVGDAAIVEVERGHDLGRVSHLGLRPGVEGSEVTVLSVLRRATVNDLKMEETNRVRESEAARICRQKIRDHNLEMKLVDADLQWDGRKLTFYFTADGRVDFRELVKDLASTFRTRIDLRQIGARDETKRIGGYGVCGRPLCCATFLNEFKPITTQMPRDQFLPLNPSKLSGVCGRLKCCLRYELDTYREFQRGCPKVGHRFRDEVKGDGAVEKLDVLREQIHIKYSSGAVEKFSQAEFREITDWRPEMPKTECICTCGRKPAESSPPPPKEERLQSASPEAGRGERVTLLAGGGLGLQSAEGGGEIQVGANMDAPLPAAPKKKRKRRRRKKGSRGAAAPPADGSATDPVDDEPDESLT